MAKYNTRQLFKKKLETEQQKYGDWIKGWVSKRDLTIIAGDSECGKSTLCVEMACCVATGENFAGYEVTESAPVLYLNYDSPEHSIMTRVEAVCKGHGLGDDEEIPVAVLSDDLPYTRDDTFAEKMIAILKEIAADTGDDRWNHPGLIVIDTLSRSANLGFTESENDVNIVNKIIDNVQKLINTLNSDDDGVGTSALMTHHPSKAATFHKIQTITKNSLSGSGAFSRDVSNIFFVEADKKNAKIKHIKILKNRDNPYDESAIIDLKLTSNTGYNRFFDKEIYTSYRFISAGTRIQNPLAVEEQEDSRKKIWAEKQKSIAITSVPAVKKQPKTKKAKITYSIDKIISDLLPIYTAVLAEKQVATLSEMRDIVARNYLNKPAGFKLTAEIAHLCAEVLIGTGVAVKTAEQPKNGLKLQFHG